MGVHKMRKHKQKTCILSIKKLKKNDPLLRKKKNNKL